jgi:hypothetical protein
VTDENEELTNEEACSRIAFTIVEEAPKLSKLLVLMLRKDGTGRSIDNGLTADEAKEMVMSFHSWVDQCLGKEKKKT